MQRCQICQAVLGNVDNNFHGWLIEDNDRRFIICFRCKEVNDKFWKVKYIGE